MLKKCTRGLRTHLEPMQRSRCLSDLLCTPLHPLLVVVAVVMNVDTENLVMNEVVVVVVFIPISQQRNSLHLATSATRNVMLALYPVNIILRKC